MYVAGYEFFVLSPVFTIHWGLQHRKGRPSWRERQNTNNRKNFDQFKREVFARYHKDPLRMVAHQSKDNKLKWSHMMSFVLIITILLFLIIFLYACYNLSLALDDEYTYMFWMSNEMSYYVVQCIAYSHCWSQAESYWNFNELSFWKRCSRTSNGSTKLAVVSCNSLGSRR